MQSEELLLTGHAAEKLSFLLGRVAQGLVRGLAEGAQPLPGVAPERAIVMGDLILSTLGNSGRVLQAVTQVACQYLPAPSSEEIERFVPGNGEGRKAEALGALLETIKDRLGEVIALSELGRRLDEANLDGGWAEFEKRLNLLFGEGVA